MEHHHSTTHQQHVKKQAIKKINHFTLAISATLHCLLGCGLGEILGMAIGTGLHMSNMTTMILAIILGAVLGLLLGIVPLLKAKFSFNKALKQVLIAEGLSIAVMETVEVLVQVYTPGVMDAHLSDGLFWKGMLFGLVAGFIAAFPVNYIFVKKGIRHH
ncbi:MAG TPA: DUF4396 domain-containing protein [Chitinophagaceae bacterium]